MKRLRHPIRAIREPFGTAGLVIACVALVAALGGTALAAAKLNSTQKKEVEKIAKKFAGKPGAPGAQGAQGNPGANGTNGKDGTNGTNGAPGESVKVTESANAIEGHCTGTTAATGKGGAKFEVGGSKAYACNGHEGSPWTAGGTLPSGSTETGVWALNPLPEELSVLGLFIPISFPIPLEHGITEAIVFEGETIPAGCTGTETGGVVTELGAEPGNLCVYVQVNNKLEELIVFNQEEEGIGAGRSGGFLTSLAATEAGAWGRGTWAVTAP
jgi:hypothetical protein